MMEPNPSRPARKVAIADHIWNAFEQMSESMGSDRDGLINQAMFMFARLNGFLEAGGASAASGFDAEASAPVSRAAAAAPKLAPVPSRPAPPVRDEALPTARPAREDRSNRLDEDPQRREVAERVLETAAELERLIKGKSSSQGEDSGVDEASGSNVDEVDEPIDEHSEPPADEPIEDEAPAGDEEEGGALYLMAESGELDKIAKERFVIGRGKHCDFVINSGKVSREHAVILRDGDQFFIEDLGSSNGTWFNKQRIKRRKIEDGDEYFICSEKIKLVVR
jgi:hypothetical protein